MSRALLRPRITALVLWLVFVASCLAVVARSHFTADLTAFLPKTPTAEQQLLVDQLKDGVVSRLILVGIEGGDAATRATLSKALGASLRQDKQFSAVANGESVGLERDRELLFAHRYALSPAVTPERFSEAGLHDAIAESIDLLASPAGLLLKSLLTRDPTGEIVQLLGQLDSGQRPPSSHGVWASRNGDRALLVVQTNAAGADTDAQETAITTLRQAFSAAQEQVGTATARDARVVMTGPGVFSVSSRATIKEEVARLSLISTGLIATLLLLIYRSLPALVLGLLPVASAALAGVAAVSLGFGLVHGITLGFGTTLIGEAVDYAIYLFVQSENRNQGNTADSSGADTGWVKAFWPTIRLGVLTSVCGFAALLFSGFPGLAQLGLYSIAGLLAAALITRYVLPYLLPRNFRIRDVTPLGLRLAGLIAFAPRLRWPLILLSVAALAVITQHHDRLWSRELGVLSPVAAADQQLDTELRADLGAPDVRYLVVVSASDSEAALQQAERVGRRLDALVEEGELAGYESPARYLPSTATQARRLASLPEADELRRRLAVAVADQPLRAERLAPFIADVEAARRQPPLALADLEGSSLALAVDSMLVRHQEAGQPDRVTALLPLKAPRSGPHANAVDVARIKAALAEEQTASPQAAILLVDMKGEMENLYASYLHEAILLSLAGVGVIVALLTATLRSARRVGQILAPLFGAVVTVTAGLLLAGQQLTILHLIGLLLIVAVGSNYALFFNQGALAPRTLASIFLANLTTVAGFGVLGLSSVPILIAIGATVGPGVVLALLFSAILAQRRPA
ncbi:hypothetical protein OTERR_20450 [Oryzomicrobium terrae]|uniref:Membrane transport protein MMPL domain-containing protein n=1 Tax=Oryzomicrobium terrae TaxID=1735038 RepID=A0A5C1E968_9RHOO|nr:MMPL family transporter [Oryzomicrobium terrae]QEL65521.1 hypothetical protein OTERR_20450 [Oryzomicrobium terrae]